MGESDDAQLAELAGLLHERNAVEARLGELLNRPVNTGSLGEWIAARIFDIELETAANAAGYDGCFTKGSLRGKTVNVKAYTRDERMLDMNSPAPCDYYLVLAGPRAAASWAGGTTRPFCIAKILLFDYRQTHAELMERGVKPGVAASILAAHWDAAEIYPRPNNPLLALNDLQRRQLELFAHPG